MEMGDLEAVHVLIIKKRISDLVKVGVLEVKWGTMGDAVCSRPF